MHPEHARACIEAWKQKEKRAETRNAALQLIIAQAQGVKINGRKPRLRDFLPDYAKPSWEDEGMAMVARELAKQKQSHG